MRRWLARLIAVLTSSAVGMGMGCEPAGPPAGSEAILYSPRFQAIGVGDGIHDRVDLPVGTKVLVLDETVAEIPGIGQLPAGFPPTSRISVKEGEHSGMVGFVEREFLKPLP